MKEPPASFLPLVDAAQAKILEMKQLLTARGIRLIVAFIPSPLSVDEVLFKQAIASSQFDESDFDRDKPYRVMEAFANANHIELVNPVEVFRRTQTASDSLYLFRDMHFSPQGHAVFARELFRYLTKSEGDALAGQVRQK